MLSDLANKLLDQIIMEGNVWPCGNLSLSMGGFEDGITGNMDIGGFLVRGDEAKSMRANEERTEDESSARPEKRQRRQKGGESIQKFFTKRGDIGEHDVRSGAEQSTDEPAFEEGSDGDLFSRGMHRVSASDSAPSSKPSVQSSIPSHMCKRCNESFDSDESIQSHNDWHYAKDLQEEDRKASNTSHARPSKKGVGRKGGSGGSGKAEKGQSKLRFG
jgi:DNA polymerase eta